MSTSLVNRLNFGDWLPNRSNSDLLKSWLKDKILKTQQTSRKTQAYQPVIQEFQTLIEDNAEIYMGFNQMFQQIPPDSPYDDVTSYKMMLDLFDLIIGEAPEFKESTVVALPITAVLLGVMDTQAGSNMFSNDTVNAQFKKMFDVWFLFLSSPASRDVLNTSENGWFGPEASEAMPNFVATYVCDPEAPYYGFESWDNFFLRLFRPGVRPVQFPENDSIVNSACESTVFHIGTNVQERDQFWIKGHPYSLFHMLDNDPLASQFIGGTVYQAFLSALNYHHWHCPVNGTVVKTVLIPGTYYMQSIVESTDHLSDTPGPAPELLDRSQGFITAVATRGLVFIQADNPSIGLMCFIAVGMVEVSTCEFTVKAGDVLKKGDKMGMFHFGGSTHCMIFRPETSITFSSEYPVGTKVNLNAAIAQVAP